MTDSSETEEESHSVRAHFFSTRSGAGVSSNSSGEEHVKVTEIRGRKYLSSSSQSEKSTRTSAKKAVLCPANKQSEREDSIPKRKRVRATRSKGLELGEGLNTEIERPRKQQRKGTSQAAASKQASSVQKEKSQSSSAEEVVFTSSIAAKWQPISPKVVSLFSDVLVTALGQSTDALEGAAKAQAEKHLQTVIREVNNELRSARAPRRKQLMDKITGKARQTMVELKDKCAALVERNKELEERLNEKTRCIDELQSRTDQLEGIEQSTTTSRTHPNQVSHILSDEHYFEEYISQLLDT